MNRRHRGGQGGAETAASVTAPVGVVRMGGVDIPLRFDHEQIRQTELAWQHLTDVANGYYLILKQAKIGVYTALCALFYGAAISSVLAGSQVPPGYDTLDKAAIYADLMAVRKELVKAAEAAIAVSAPPEAEKNA